MAHSYDEDPTLPDDKAERELIEKAELSFEDEEEEGRAGDLRSRADIEQHQPPRQAREAGLTGASFPGEGPTDDDLSLETLIDEDGARSPEEPGHGLPADKDLKITDGRHIGAGGGLDEAELAHTDPLDKKPWDGRPDD